MNRVTEYSSASDQPDTGAERMKGTETPTTISLALPVVEPSPEFGQGPSIRDSRSAVLAPGSNPIDISEIRAKLEARGGKEFWKSLDEIAETPEFQDYVKHEFPAGADTFTDPIGRRNFMKVMGASIALAGLGACVRQPDEKIVPYVKQPEQLVLGKPLFFATAALHNGYALGVLAESHMGRPTKIEGNPEHPASLGATDIFAQASVLSMYDPARSQTVLSRGAISDWSSFTQDLQLELSNQKATGGAGIRILTGTVTSPTLAAQIRSVLAAYPAAKWHQYDPINRSNMRIGLQGVLGRAADPIYHFERADVVVSLDSDFLFELPGSVRYARDFIDRRRLETATADMNRLYVVEPTPTITGAKADHRIAMRASEVGIFTQALAQQIGISVTNPHPVDAKTMQFVSAIAADLQASGRRGRTLVVAGDHQPAAVHALAHAINQRLGNVGSTVTYVTPVEENPVDHNASIRELVADLNAKDGGAPRVQMLLMVGVNPVYSAPADLNFKAAMENARFRAHVGLYTDETSRHCHWHIPESHPLESWSDARSYDGTITIIQPLIAPLYQTKTAHEVIEALAGGASRSSHDIVRAYWQQRSGGNFEAMWRKSLHDGMVGMSGSVATRATESGRTMVAGTGATAPVAAPTAPPQRPDSVIGVPSAAPRDTTATAAPASTTPLPTIPPIAAPVTGRGLEVIFRPDPTIWDGRYSRNGWLQELPKPISKLTWDNAVHMSPATAERLGLRNEDTVELRYRNVKVQGPVWILPGHVDNAVTLHLGYGRGRMGGQGIGFDAYRLRSSEAPYFDAGLEIVATGDRYPLATTQDHSSMEGRDLVRSVTLEELRAPKKEEHAVAHASMLEEYVYDGYAWGMAIDLNACIGCNACTIACQSENNIPVVGKDQVLMGREMHWIRIDRYFHGPLDGPDTYFQPLPCMHCEKAPCEVVCPVGATVHDEEGLNNMIYNRCIGTRYCSNNCPYKVRRYNFLKYVDETVETTQLMSNPDVTLRIRGVMEKCTYCVQRINAARIEAKREDRRILDGEIETACQSVCPTEAIVFGDINDKTSQVVKAKSSPRNYALLTDLNTEPRTSYLSSVRNPNPAVVALEPKKSVADDLWRPDDH